MSASRIISVFSAKGGTGKTFIGVNLASTIHRQLKEPVAMVDMNTSYFSDLSKLVSSSDGLKLFDAKSKSIDELLRDLEASYKYIIIDAGSILTDNIITTFSLSNLILLVTTPDILSLNQSRSILDVLDKLKFPIASMVKVVLNRADSRGSLSSTESKDFLPCEIIGTIPSNGRIAGLAVNQQKTVAEIEPKSNIAESFKRLAQKLINDPTIFVKQAKLGIDRSKIEPFGTGDVVDVIHRKDTSEYSAEQAKEDAIVELKRKIHHALVDEMDLRHIDIYTMTDPEKIKEFRQHAERIILHLLTQEEGFIASIDDRDRLIKEIADDALGLGPLEELLSDPEISDILVNNKDQIYVEKHGKLYLSNKKFISNDHILTVLDKIISPLGRRIDESNPMVDARLPDGSRVNAIIPPLSTKGPMISIRKFGIVKYTTDDLVKIKTLTPEMAQFLNACIVARKNIIVTGGTGSGKTTLLNVLSHFIPDNERIITIEDAVELNISKEHWASLEARPPNIEGKGAITIRSLFRNCLRMRPDRIIVGECRGDETLDMLQAMNTGHDGSLTTIHANSPKDAVARLDSLVLMSNIELPIRAIREQIASAIHLMVHIARLSDGSRKVMAIDEVVGMDKDADIVTKDIFIFQQTGVDEDGKVQGAFKATGYRPTFLEELRVKGIEIDEGMFKS